MCLYGKAQFTLKKLTWNWFRLLKYFYWSCPLKFLRTVIGGRGSSRGEITHVFLQETKQKFFENNYDVST